MGLFNSSARESTKASDSRDSFAPHFFFKNAINIHKSINMIHQISKWRDKNRCGKLFGNIQHRFMTKALQEVGTEEHCMCLSLMSEACPEARASSLVGRARDFGSGTCPLLSGAGTWGGRLLLQSTGGPESRACALVSEARFWVLWYAG